MVVTKEFLKNMEDAYYYNSASSSGYCPERSYEMVRALVKGESLYIESDNLEIRTIEEYMEWKRPYDYLNVAITSECITRAKIELFPTWEEIPRKLKTKGNTSRKMVSIEYLKNMEDLFNRNTPSTIGGLKYLSYEMVKSLTKGIPLFLEDEGRTITSIKEYLNWIKPYNYLKVGNTNEFINEAEKEVKREQEEVKDAQANQKAILEGILREIQYIQIERKKLYGKKSNPDFEVTKHFIEKMKSMYQLSKGPSFGVCDIMQYKLVKTLVCGGSLIIEEENNLIIDSIEAYSKWKKPYEYLNFINTWDLVVKAIYELKQELPLVKSKLR
ncbi:hypothetical protein E7Z59_08110 [Robertkochia marina]|uniref:Uncharacterized protein n=1 Tax=Robertkochia marina TaxID=1227945 RepID=A0A4S3M0S9_9FLAO|nr:hypothetical protein [Robertkochia marina]THD67613.1 hypothetical protein E7Z59_08110 [Robertkochia marina]TRZ43345.1 hypothetical protein D3A96_10245 [Robertkochia marina]